METGQGGKRRGYGGEKGQGAWAAQRSAKAKAPRCHTTRRAWTRAACADDCARCEGPGCRETLTPGDGPEGRELGEK
eukprot:4861994-Pyramimonas_sp.AAC.1